MVYVANTGNFYNSGDVNSTESKLYLFGPSTAANLGGGITAALNFPVRGDIIFVIAGLTSETVGVSISQDGTNYSAALVVVNAATGVDTANATLGNGTYLLPFLRFGSPMYVKFTKSSTTESAAVACAVPYFPADF